MRVFLTGGTGFIGQPLTQALLRRRWKVTALVRKLDSAQAKAIRAMGAQLVKGDITDRESMREAMAGADAVIHNAAWYELGITRRAHALMHAINVQGTENTLGLAIESGTPRIVHVSTILAFGDTGNIVADETFQRRAPPQSCYEQTKTEAHTCAVQLQEQGAPIVIACPASVIGPGDHTGMGHLARWYVRGLLGPVLMAPDGCCAYVHVDDVAEAIVRCVEYGCDGEAYILSNGVMRHRDLFQLWKQTPGGSQATPLSLPDSLTLLLNRVAEPVERFLGLPVIFCREFALAGLGHWQFSAAKAERELGMRFRSVEQAWLDTLEAERAIAQKKESQ